MPTSGRKEGSEWRVAKQTSKMVKNSELVKMKTLHLSLNDFKSPSGFTCPKGPEAIVHASQKTQNKLKNHKIFKKNVLLLFA